MGLIESNSPSQHGSMSLKMKRKVEGMVQTTIWLPQQMHQRLKQIGGAGGASEAIRNRLEASFEAEKAVSPKTQELLDDISYIAGETAKYCGDCFEDAFAFEVLKESVESLLTAVRPKGDGVMNSDYSEMAGIVFGSVLPKDISRTLVSDVMRARAKRADEGKRR